MDPLWHAGGVGEPLTPLRLVIYYAATLGQSITNYNIHSVSFLRPLMPL